MKRIITLLATTAAVLPAVLPSPAGADTNCKAIATQVAQIEHQIADLAKTQAEDMNEAAPGQKHTIIDQYKKEKKALQDKLAKKKQQLNACVKSPIAHVPMTIRVSAVHCAIETDEAGADEPYVLAYAVDLTTQRVFVVNGQPVSMAFPTGHVGLTGPWDDVDHGEVHSATELPAALRRPFWNLAGNPHVIANADDVVFVAALMENDDGKPKVVRSALDLAMQVALVAAPTGDRAALVHHLAGAMNGLIGAAALAGTSGPNLDDKVGSARELRLTENDLRYVAHMGALGKTLSFVGDGGKYQLDFTLTAA